MPYAIVTRDAGAAAPYATALAALGLEVVAMPVTRSAPPSDPDALARALARGGHAAIACTSPRAARAVLDARGGASLPEIWAVGPATARPFEQAGIAVEVPPEASDGIALARALLAARALAGRRVLLPRAEDGREELRALLEAAGVVVEMIGAYRTVAAPPGDPVIAEGRALIAGGRAAVCAIFAPSQVTALVRLVDGAVLRAMPFAAIGETTARALREAGAAIVAVADAPTPSGIANAVASVYPPRS